MTDADKGFPARSARGISRRQLLATGATAGGALAIGGVIGQSARADASSAPTPHLTTLTAAEAALFAAMADRVFPADADSKSASDLGFVAYLDGQLSGSWGTGEGLYRHGPFHEATTSGMGYQLPLVPRDLYKQIAATIDQHAHSTAGKPFASLDPSQQDAMMTALEDGKVDLGYATNENGYTSASFFADFLSVVNQALFADPIYGGNRDVGGWEWVGYPGDPMAYGDAYWAIFPQQDDPYTVTPKGLADSPMGGLPASTMETSS